MAESKKSSQTSKTAHVMNLLGKSRASDHGAGSKTDKEGPRPSILSADALDTAASANIQKALEGALEEESAGQQTSAAVLTTPVAQSEGPVLPSAAPPILKAEEAPQPHGNHSPEAQVPSAVSKAEAVPRYLPGMSYVNVMQALAEERVDKYMEMFGICTCLRCKADVTALALCNLPPKYVVMGQGETIPRITLYEQQYSAAITAAIVRSCKVVMERPHHDR